MSSFYDDASLVVIPSGYKTSKIYAEKPTDGSGDLTFTRASDATRVGPDGLIEKVRTNLVLQSQTFDSASWTAYSGTTVTANAVTAPDGTLTAEQITGTSGSFRGIRQAISSSAIPHTFSVYLRSATGSSTTARIWVDGTNTTVTVTTSWQRFTVTGTTAASFEVQISTAVSSAIDVYAWGAQLETGDIATNYIPTTTAAVSVGPVSNVPRLDYLGSSCPRLLLEPQRSSLVLYSEQLNNAAWIKQTVTISANISVSPDGYSNADKVAINNGVSGGYVYQSIATTSSTVYTTSFFVKAAGINFTKFYSNVTGSYVTAVINLTTGAITNSDFATTPTATNYGNGWWRVSYTETSGGGSVPIYVDGGSTSTGGGITGNGTDGILIWGAQLEAGAYATSYIPTLGASVTRVADAASKTGISSLIGQTEGTLFAEIFIPSIATAGTFANFTLSDGTSSNLVTIAYYPDGRIQAAAIVGGSLTVNIDLTSYGLTAGTHKFAFAYKLNDYVFYVDGVQQGTDTSSGVPAMSKFDLFDAVGATLNYKQALLFKTRLTNAQLAELTTL